MGSGARTGRDEQQRRYAAACRDIKGCQSWLELQRVYQQLGHSLDHIQAVALLSGLAKTAPAATAPLNEVQEYRQLVAQVLTMTVASHAPRYAASNCTGIHADPAQLLQQPWVQGPVKPLVHSNACLALLHNTGSGPAR